MPIEQISDNILNSIPNGRKRAVSVNQIISEKNNSITADNKDKPITDSYTDNKLSKKVLDDISDNAQAIYDIVYENPSTVDDIIIKTKLPVSAIMQAFTELELEEAITRKSGGIYYPVWFILSIIFKILSITQSIEIELK